jgi:hypothetical protein
MVSLAALGLADNDTERNRWFPSVSLPSFGSPALALAALGVQGSEGVSGGRDRFVDLARAVS